MLPTLPPTPPPSLHAGALHAGALHAGALNEDETHGNSQVSDNEGDAESRTFPCYNPSSHRYICEWRFTSNYPKFVKW